MMARRWRWAVGFALGLAAAVGPAHADAVRPWSGASASANGTTNTGASATASDQWERLANATKTNMGVLSSFKVPAWGSSSARAGGPMGSLLEVDTKTALGNAGSADTSFPGGGGTSRAEARWSDDVIRITAPAGAALPDQIQVRLSLTYDASATPNWANPSYGSLTARANGTEISISDPAVTVWTEYLAQFDRFASDAERSVGRFHTNLNVNADGESDPITLELAAENLARPMTWTDSQGSHHAVLGIDAVTFLDGTPLADRGYVVSFASAEVVPEPASVLAWGGLSLAGAWLVRRRRARRAA